MTSTPTDLAELLDSLTDQALAGVVESDRTITIHSLSAGDGEGVRHAVRRLAWPISVVDGADAPADLDDLADDMGPFRITVEKPDTGPTRTLVTAAGLKQALSTERAPGPGAWWVARLQTRFDTETLCLVPWGEVVGDVASRECLKSPREFVREIADKRLVPDDIRPWLMAHPDRSLDLWPDVRFQVFAQCAAIALFRAIASEVVSAHDVAFIGPPRRTLPLTEKSVVQRLGDQGFAALQHIARWVYEDIPSTEQRHALLAAEIVRSTSAQDDVAAALRTSGTDMLQGARLAYQLGLADLSKEAIKAQADLRKAVADDTAKSADGARSTAAGLATAIATGIGLFVARGINGASDGLLAAVAVAVAVYLFVVGASSLRHLEIQRRLRQVWRHRFYRFIPDDDYRKMVIEPVQQAEQVFRLIAWLCLYASEILLAVACKLFIEHAL